jgi:probable FeS assembly SUF system protein SufT
VVTIAQTLGGAVTVHAGRELFRIDREHAVAIEGYTPEAPAAEASAAEAFSEQRVWDVLKTCYDPEIPLNIVDLGLVYDLAVTPTGDGRNHIEVKMTLTAPGCGMGPMIAEDARIKIVALPGVASAVVHMVWDPAWTAEMISAQGRQVLGLE